MTTTKEPNKDFRQAVMEVIEIVSKEPSYMTIMPEEATVRILALCKEMLVPERQGIDTNNPVFIGWNACRQHLLKQLGEKV